MRPGSPVARGVTESEVRELRQVVWILAVLLILALVASVLPVALRAENLAKTLCAVVAAGTCVALIKTFNLWSTLKRLG